MSGEGCGTTSLLLSYGLGVPSLVAVQIWWGGMGAGFGTRDALHDTASMAASLTTLVVSSCFVVYFITFFFTPKVDPETRLDALRLFELGPWLLATVTSAVTAFTSAYLQDAERPQVNFTEEYKHYGENTETLVGHAFAAVLFVIAILSIVLMIKMKRLTYFLVGSNYSFVRPLITASHFLVHMLLFPYNGEDGAEAYALNIRRENIVLVFYFGLPTLCGFANAFIFRMDFGLFTSKSINDVKIGQIVAAIALWAVVPAALCAFLPSVPPDSASMSGSIGDQGSFVDNLSNMFYHSGYFLDLGLITLFYFLAKRMESLAFWRFFGICGMSSLLFLLTEGINACYCRRTWNMSYNYYYHTQFTLGGIGLACGVATLVLGPVLGLGCCSAVMKDGVATASATMPVLLYKLYIGAQLPPFFLFSFLYPLTGSTAGYYFSPATAFTYVTGVAVPAYHLFSYGVLRTFDISVAQESLSQETGGFLSFFQ